MKIVIDDLELTFKGETAQHKMLWHSTLRYAQYELDFEFDELLFSETIPILNMKSIIFSNLMKTFKWTITTLTLLIFQITMV